MNGQPRRGRGGTPGPISSTRAHAMTPVFLTGDAAVIPPSPPTLPDVVENGSHER